MSKQQMQSYHYIFSLQRMWRHVISALGLPFDFVRKGCCYCAVGLCENARQRDLVLSTCPLRWRQFSFAGRWRRGGRAVGRRGAPGARPVIAQLWRGRGKGTSLRGPEC